MSPAPEPPQVKPGDLYFIGPQASVQFGPGCEFVARVIKVRNDISTYDGWLWLEVYQLDERGDAVERRDIWVKPPGLKPVYPRPAPPSGAVTRRRPVNRGPRGAGGKALPPAPVATRVARGAAR